MAGKSKKFRIATEGATTDGRVIERVWIEQMAKNYNPALYGARINMEHIKGYTPDSPFKRYGDVLSLTTAENSEGKLELFGVIDPTEDLVAMTKARQKIYTSMEVNTAFADTGEAYLVGLAVTDDPASLGTEMLQFSASAAHNPLAKRKTSPKNLFSEAVEFTLEMEEERPANALLEGFSTKIKTILGSFKHSNDSNFTEVRHAIEVIADSQKTLLEKYTEILTPRTAEFVASQGPDLIALSAALKKQEEAHDDLLLQLSQQPGSSLRPRTPGGSSGAITTDC